MVNLDSYLINIPQNLYARSSSNVTAPRVSLAINYCSVKQNENMTSILSLLTHTQTSGLFSLSAILEKQLSSQYFSLI